MCDRCVLPTGDPATIRTCLCKCTPFRKAKSGRETLEVRKVFCGQCMHEIEWPVKFTAS